MKDQIVSSKSHFLMDYGSEAEGRAIERLGKTVRLIKWKIEVTEEMSLRGSHQLRPQRDSEPLPA